MSRFLWTQKEDIGPSARFGHAMTYDAVRSRTILFAGSLLAVGQHASVSVTWEWNGEFWTQIAPSGKITRCVLIAFARLRFCLAACLDKTPRLATLGLGMGKTGRKLTIADRQPGQATVSSLTLRVGARCFLVGDRQLESSTTHGSGTARRGPNRQTQVPRLDGITRSRSTWCTTA